MFLRSTLMLWIGLSATSMVPVLYPSYSESTQPFTQEVSYNLSRQSHKEGRGSGRRRFLNMRTNDSIITHDV